MELEGKVALVTGTGPNIMGGIAEGMAEEGANVVCIDINPNYAEQCAKSVTEIGRRAIAIACDVTDEAQITAAVEQAKAEFGGIDILVNGATVFNWKGVLDMPLVEWRRQTDVMLTGAFLFTKLVAQQMIDQGRSYGAHHGPEFTGYASQPSVDPSAYPLGLGTVCRLDPIQTVSDGVGIGQRCA